MSSCETWILNQEPPVTSPFSYKIDFETIQFLLPFASLGANENIKRLHITLHE
jgi:hypothetical protein